MIVQLIFPFQISFHLFCCTKKNFHYFILLIHFHLLTYITFFWLLFSVYYSLYLTYSFSFFHLFIYFKYTLLSTLPKTRPFSFGLYIVRSLSYNLDFSVWYLTRKWSQWIDLPVNCYHFIIFLLLEVDEKVYKMS